MRLVRGDFLEEDLDGKFDVVLALGLFDYQAEPARFAQRFGELTAPGGSVVGSFPRWDWLKGPVRKLRYEVINNCPIFDYTRDGLMQLFGDFSNIEIRGGKSGFLLRATA